MPRLDMPEVLIIATIVCLMIGFLLVFAILPFWMIFSKAGFSPWLSLTQIIPLVIGDADRTMQLAARMREAGFFIPGIRPPTVPSGESLLRLSLSYHHTPEMIDALLEALCRCRS